MLLLYYMQGTSGCRAQDKFIVRGLQAILVGRTIIIRSNFLLFFWEEYGLLITRVQEKIRDAGWIGRMLCVKCYGLRQN